MFYRILIGMILLLVSIGCSATAQRSDIILIEGKELRLNTNSLKKYLRESDWKPPEEAAIWSSNWRGYIANWKIEAGYLILTDISIELKNDASLERKRKSILTGLFPSTKSIKANWYSGALVVPDGK